MSTKKAVLVYQGGIANVFEVQCFNMADYGRDAKRLLQADFRECEAYARGLAQAGCKVASAYCNLAGDVSYARWTADLNEAPFRDEFRPVFMGVVDPENPPKPRKRRRPMDPDRALAAENYGDPDDTDRSF